MISTATLFTMEVLSMSEQPFSSEWLKNKLCLLTTNFLKKFINYAL